MERIKNLEDLEIGDWVKVCDKNISKKHFKIGEITHKWDEWISPCFQLKIFETNLPLTTQQVLKKMGKEMFGGNKEYNQGKFDEEYRIFRLNKEEKSTLLKKMILKNL